MTIASSSFTSCGTKQLSPLTDDPAGDPRQWSVDDVCRWAAARPLVAPAESSFRRHSVDGHVLINYVTNVTLAEELDVTAFGTRVYVLEAVETLRWDLGLHQPLPRPSSRTSSSSVDTKQHRSISNTPEDSDHSPLAIKSAAAIPSAKSKRSASRIADAEKKRQKRAEMKKNPALYAEYLRKERERNARRRRKQRLEKEGSLQQQQQHPSFLPAPVVGNDSTTTPSTVVLASPLIPPVHNIRQTAAISDKQQPQPQQQPQQQLQLWSAAR